MVIEEPRPKKRKTIITWIIIITCLVIFLITLGSDGVTVDMKIAYEYGFSVDNFGKSYTLLTAAFLHGDWLHIIGNMYFLYVFGDDAEDTMGRITFVVFYLFCAVFASAFFGLVTLVTANITGNFALLAEPAVGASGAIFGVLAAYAIFFPKRLLVIPGWGKVPAKFYLIIYAIMETIAIFTGPLDNVAHSAHVGGFIAGVIFVYIFKKLNNPQYQIVKLGKS